MFLCIVLRIGGTWVVCKVTGRRFTCFDRPVLRSTAASARESGSADIERPSPKAPSATVL